MLKLMMKPPMGVEYDRWYPTGVQGSEKTMPEKISDYLWAAQWYNNRTYVDDNEMETMADRLMSGETLSWSTSQLRVESE